MDPQLLMQSPATDFHFESTSTSAYATAPSSPKVTLPNFFFSAPTSPTSSLYDVSPINPDAADDFRSTEPFANCDQNQGHRNEDYEEEDTDFAFDFSGQLERPSISDAEDLFHGGKIKPLDPPKSPMFSPRAYSKRYFEASSDSQTKNPYPRTPTSTKHKKSQSLSPALRVSEILSDHQKSSTHQSSPFNFIWCNKWNLKNLLLFRSTSEGSAVTSDGLLKKYGMITKSEQDSRNSSFRSCNGGGSVDGSSSKRMRRKVSAHEIHYTANRAVKEEMKKKTFLPYKSGLLGCLEAQSKSHDSRFASVRVRGTGTQFARFLKFGTKGGRLISVRSDSVYPSLKLPFDCLSFKD
ncbi:hypothetical protein LXL04_017435 [Taraxacum kok-saghyz]